MDMESDTVGTIDRRKRKLEGRYDGAKLKDLLLLEYRTYVMYCSMHWDDINEEKR